MNFEEINFEDFEDVDFESEYNDNFEFTEEGENMYQLTKEGEKNVSEFVEECRKRYKKISEYYRALSGHYTDCVDHVELPTREIILHEINSGERFLEDVWCVGDKYYMSDWCLSKKHNIYVSLELKYGTDFIRIRKEIYSMQI